MMWLFTLTLLVVIVGKEAKKERQDFIKRNGMTRNQLFRACKYMRGEKGKVSYRELLQNMNNN
jgi:hypothetical protein